MILKKLKSLFKIKNKEFNPQRIVTPKEVNFYFEVKQIENSHILQGHGFCWFVNRPSNDDGLLCEMQSGRKVLYKFYDVEKCANPNDMYFAKAEPIRYVD